MTALRLLALVAVTTAVAHADVTIARDLPPPPPPPIVIADDPPPPPPPIVIATPVLVSSPPRVRPLLGDRWTVTAETGIGWLQLHGQAGGGLLIRPTLTRTFDRLELSAAYALIDWFDSDRRRPSGTVHRLGAAAHYQLGRIRVEHDKMTLDLVGAAGLAWQHVVPEHGPTIDRPDVSLGIVLRMLTDLDDRKPTRIFFGMDLGVHLLVAPRLAAEPDLGVMVSFGVPIGW